MVVVAVMKTQCSTLQYCTWSVIEEEEGEGDAEIQGKYEDKNKGGRCTHLAKKDDDDDDDELMRKAIIIANAFCFCLLCNSNSSSCCR